MIKEVDDSGTGSIGMHSFFHIFRMGRSGELEEGSGLYNLYAQIDNIDVAKEGVAGAAGFFEAKVKGGCQAECGTGGRNGNIDGFRLGGAQKARG